MITVFNPLETKGSDLLSGSEDGLVETREAPPTSYPKILNLLRQRRALAIQFNLGGQND
jgi:hypothetical protein